MDGSSSFIKSVFQKGFSCLNAHHSVLAKQGFSVRYLRMVSQEDILHGLILDMVTLENFQVQVGAAAALSESAGRERTFKPGEVAAVEAPGGFAQVRRPGPHCGDWSHAERKSRELRTSRSARHEARTWAGSATWGWTPLSLRLLGFSTEGPVLQETQDSRSPNPSEPCFSFCMKWWS